MDLIYHCPQHPNHRHVTLVSSYLFNDFKREKMDYVSDNFEKIFNNLHKRIVIMNMIILNLSKRNAQCNGNLALNSK